MGASEGQVLKLADGSEVVVRPIGPDDASLLQAFVRRLSARSRRFRFFVALAELSAAQLDRFVIESDRRGRRDPGDRSECDAESSNAMLNAIMYLTRAAVCRH